MVKGVQGGRRKKAREKREGGDDVLVVIVMMLDLDLDLSRCIIYNSMYYNILCPNMNINIDIYSSALHCSLG